MAKGEVVDWSNYNVYTVANVAKRFLLSIPGGIFGEHNERRILVSAVPPTGTLQSQTTTEPTAIQQRLPTKLKHAPGFETASYVESRTLERDVKSIEVFVSSIISDETGFLCDFGMLPPSPAEREQLDLFIE